MEKALEQLLEGQGLNAELKSALVEAWTDKLSEARQQVEEQVRDELSKRYEHDKTQLVEAMEKFLHEHLAREVQLFNDTKKKISEDARAREKDLTKKVGDMKGVVTETLKKELENVAEEKNRLAEERAKYAKLISEAKSEVKKTNESKMAKLTDFVRKQLGEELSEFEKDKKNLSEERIKLHKELREARLGYKDAYAERLKTLEQFVLRQLTEEIKEFSEDKKLLENRRVELETQTVKKLEETKKAFIQKAARLIEGKVTQSMTNEMKQLKEDLKVARENNFGRRLFEAFAAEYMTSYLAEGSEIRKLQAALGGIKKQVMESKKQLAEKDKALAAAQRKIALTEERAQRAKVMNELISPLPRDQKKVMSNLLESVKTEKLNDAFKRYLPSVLRETGAAKPEEGTGKKVLQEKTEARKTDKETTVAMTGDRKNRLAETINEENRNDPSVIQIRKLAGL